MPKYKVSGRNGKKPIIITASNEDAARIEGMFQFWGNRSWNKPGMGPYVGRGLDVELLKGKEKDDAILG